MSARLSALSLGVALFLCLLVGCGADMSPSVQSATVSPRDSNADGSGLTDVAERIEEGREPAGTVVIVVGYCRGWDLLDEIGYAPPVTKSDWVVADHSGAVYVLANGVDVVAANGDYAQGFSVYEPDRTDRLLQVTGVVRVSRDARGYVEPTEIRLLE